MPFSRFALYFFGLAACSTLAFASGFAGKVVTSDGSAALEAAAERPACQSERAEVAHRHALIKMTQFARAE